MGNSSVKEAVEEAEGDRCLDLSCKLDPQQYVKHVSGEFIEGCVLAFPWEMYYNTVSMYEYVNASFNFISEIPEELSLHVPHLRVLNISHNQITSFPHSFNLLLHLRELDVSYNRLKALPETVIRLPQLHTLNLAYNSITELPASITRLKQLRKLNISYNNIRALPGALIECPKLQVLVAHGNDLIHPPQAICDASTESAFIFLKERHKASSEGRLKVKSSVFERVRGQQVLASVNNPESASVEYRQAQGTSRANKRKCPLMPPADATMLNADQLKDMLIGLVYGAAIGDAVGLCTEGLTRSECKFFYDKANFSLDARIRDHLRSHYPPCDWSCNTDIMVLSKDGYSANPHTAANSVYKEVKDDMSRGIFNLNPCDNSCLPSALVLGIPNFYKEHEVEMNAERICQASHSSPIARASCVFLALLVASLLKGSTVNDVPAFMKIIENLIKTVAKKHLSEKDEQIFLNVLDIKVSEESCSNDVLTSIGLLMNSLGKKNGYDFKSQILDIVMRGGEGICVHASVTGGILGALLGYSNLPQDWLKQLPQENVSLLNSKLNLLLDLFGLP
ncbi:uncharacterized protein LOC135218382 isoform X2 [Macrobrachium nipponense]|uniref:uncharacterized protein LOC135218382 isoform X2 n=1 Tax=Macrobrachium nipponense TaxID=159736 RepID=UPI0030C7D464